jgi:hypothetical protein
MSPYIGIVPRCHQSCIEAINHSSCLARQARIYVSRDVKSRSPAHMGDVGSIARQGKWGLNLAALIYLFVRFAERLR